MTVRSPQPRPIAAACALVLTITCCAAFGQPVPTQPPPSTLGRIGPPSSPPPAAKKAAEQWQTAVRLQKAKKLNEAAKEYTAFLRTVKQAGLASSSAIPAYQNLALIYRSLGSVADLVETLKSWSALAPQNAAIHAELASTYASPRVQKFDAAVAEARRALALKPTKELAAAAHAAIGMAGVANKNFASAEQEFGAAARLVPGNAQMQYNYALALVERKKFLPALAAMEKAAAINPKMAGAWYYVGLLNETQQRFPQAIMGFRRAIHLAPKDPTIHFDLARVLVRSNDIDSAISEYLTVLELAPQSLPARIAVAQLYVQLRNFSAARVHYAEAAKLAPKNASVLAGLAESETQIAGQPQDAAGRAAFLKHAEEHYKAAAAIDPKYIAGTNGLAHFYERTGSFAKAQEIYRKRIEADPQEFGNYNALAETYIMQRKPDDAIATWRRYRDLHPENPSPYMRTADALEGQGKWLDAVGEWRLLLKQKDRTGFTSGAMVSIGKDLARAGQTKEATAELEAVLKLDTSAADAPKETRAAVAATVESQRLAAMQELAQIAEHGNALDDAIRWQQQIKAEEAGLAAKTHGSPNTATYLALARLYQQAKKPDLAIKELDALTQTNQPKRENLAPAFEELAQVYESQKRYDDAIEAYRRSAQYSREPLNGRLRAAEIYQRSNRLPLAIAEFEAIRKDFPKESRVLAPLALAYRQAGRDEDAIRVYDDLMASDPRATWARDQKAVVLTHMKRYDDARALYEAQLAQNPQNRQLYADIAFVFQSEGKPDALLDWALPRLEKAPANATLMAVVLDEAARQKHEERGWSILRTSAEKHKEQRAVVEATAGLMAQRGKHDDAIVLYRQIAAQYPNDLSAQLTLADELFAAGHKDDASKLYGDLIARPNIAPSERLTVRRQFARCCVEQGNSTEALVQLQEVFKADPSDFDSASRLALLLEAAGRASEAIPVLESLATREVYDATVRAQIRSKLGALYLKKGDKQAAAAQYREAIALNPKDTASQAALAQLNGK
jgi:tetratricopeptide (TPR) repeat protein